MCGHYKRSTRLCHQPQCDATTSRRCKMSGTPRNKTCDKKLKLAEQKISKIINKIEALKLSASYVSKLSINRSDGVFWKLPSGFKRWFWLSIILAVPLCVYYYCSSPGCLIGMPFDKALFRAPEDCSMCRDVGAAVRLNNISRRQFELQYAYSPTPVIITDGVQEWRAAQEFSFEFFSQFYKRGKLGKQTNDCFFFSYKSGLSSLSEVFDMEPERANLTAGTAPWYVGWNTCYDAETRELRKYYTRPYFLPESAESDMVDWIFMGGPGQGAHMHVDSVRHMSWQAQVRGSKEWVLAPPPECLYACAWLTFTVRPGEILVVDTNRWYHKTSVLPGEISITIGAEYD